MIDRLCLVRDIAIATHGQVIEALIANRLTSPAPLVHVEDWAKAFAVAEVLGVGPATLNDDLLGRALDAIAGHLDEIVGSIGATAIGEFGIDVSRLHWDMTSISLVGDYDTPESGSSPPPTENRIPRPGLTCTPKSRPGRPLDRSWPGLLAAERQENDSGGARKMTVPFASIRFERSPKGQAPHNPHQRFMTVPLAATRQPARQRSGRV